MAKLTQLYSYIRFNMETGEVTDEVLATSRRAAIRLIRGTGRYLGGPWVVKVEAEGRCISNFVQDQLLSEIWSMPAL